MGNSKLLLFEKSANKIRVLAMSKFSNLLDRCTIKITFFQPKYSNIASQEERRSDSLVNSRNHSVDVVWVIYVSNP